MAYLDHFKYELLGDESRPALVFLHGVMGSSSNWRQIAKTFADRYHILLFDQRGHGRSFHPPTGYAVTDYAEDLRLIIDELDWSEIFLVGHSLGGRGAMAFAHRHPRRVRALVIEDIVPSQASHKPTRTEELIRAVPVPFASRKLAREYFTTEFVDRFSDRRNIWAVGQFLYANIIEDEAGRGVWRVYLQGIYETLHDATSVDRWSELSNWSVPTLLVRGAESDEITRADFARMVAASPFIEGAEVARAGHWVHFDQPEAFVKLVDDFFARCRRLA